MHHASKALKANENGSWAENGRDFCQFQTQLFRKKKSALLPVSVETPEHIQGILALKIIAK